MKCENCEEELRVCFRFTDWENDANDEYGDYDHCLGLFNEAVERNETGRYSIYDVSSCESCGESKDEGILFNEKCPEYAGGK